MSGMSHNRVRRRRPRNVGDLAALRRMLWACLLEAEYLLQTADDPELILKCIHAISTVGGSYVKLVEAVGVDTRLKQVETTIATLGHRNGHARAQTL